MEKQNGLRFFSQLTKIANKLHELSKLPMDIGTDERLYPSEIHTIDAIGRNYATVTDISIEFGITKGAVSQVVAKLNKRGYINKSRKTSSKEIILSLTNKGQQAFNSHKKLHQTLDKEYLALMNNIPEEQFQLFQLMLTKIEEHVGEYIKYGKKTL